MFFHLFGNSDSSERIEAEDTLAELLMEKEVEKENDINRQEENIKE